MNIHNRLTTVADCFTMAEEFPDYEAAWLTMAEEIYITRPCTDGHVFWQESGAYFCAYDQEAETLDGYVIDDAGLAGRSLLLGLAISLALWVVIVRTAVVVLR